MTMGVGSAVTEAQHFTSARSQVVKCTKNTTLPLNCLVYDEYDELNSVQTING